MQEAVKQRIYLLVMVFSIFMVSVLVVSMALDKPIGIKSASIHVPPNVTISAPKEQDGGQGFVFEVPDTEPLSTESKRITEEALMQEMAQHLPESFPLEAVQVDITAEGQVSFHTELKRKTIETYMEKAGIKLSLKQSIVFKLMPEAIEAEAVLLCQPDSDGGLLLLTPQKIVLNGTEIKADELPTGFIDEIGTAVNRLITAGGFYYSRVEFEDGAMVLVP